ncbi:MAG TPA: hypothetical protein VII96_07275 [Acidimicrobiales bacterium]
MHTRREHTRNKAGTTTQVGDPVVVDVCLKPSGAVSLAPGHPLSI